MVEIRYGVAPAHWGRGYASEAASCIMRWAEAERGVKRFIAETEIDNQGSRTILEAKLGFKALPVSIDICRSLVAEARPEQRILEECRRDRVGETC